MPLLILTDGNPADFRPPVSERVTMGANLEASETKSLDQQAMLERALSAFEVELPAPAAMHGVRRPHG